MCCGCMTHTSLTLPWAPPGQLPQFLACWLAMRSTRITWYDIKVAVQGVAQLVLQLSCSAQLPLIPSRHQHCRNHDCCHLHQRCHHRLHCCTHNIIGHIITAAISGAQDGQCTSQPSERVAGTAWDCIRYHTQAVVASAVVNHCWQGHLLSSSSCDFVCNQNVQAIDGRPSVCLLLW